VVYERFWPRLSLFVAFELSKLSMAAVMEFMALFYWLSFLDWLSSILLTSARFSSLERS
jgi:hypothetical protein